MRYLSAPLLFSLAALLASCSEGTPVEADASLVVVRAYLYAGQAVTDVQLSGTVALGSTDSTAPPVNDAQVVLARGTQSWTLERAPGDSGYYRYTGADLEVRAGDRFDIRITRGGQVVTASTIVPDAPVGLVLSKDTLAVPANPGISWARSDSARVMVSWTNVPGTLAYVVVENLETNPEPITMPGGPSIRGRQRFIAPPTDRSDYGIGFMNLTHYGRHRITVYRINQEYADLYRTRQQDSRDLNEPLTNVAGGLGVFSAFNGVSTTLLVMKR
jgi:hypothetical protein